MNDETDPREPGGSGARVLKLMLGRSHDGG
jgi:hypothetical protein